MVQVSVKFGLVEFSLETAFARNGTYLKDFCVPIVHVNDRHTVTATTKSNSYMLLLSVNNFTWKRNEDMELYISVYMTGGSTAEQRAPR